MGGRFKAIFAGALIAVMAALTLASCGEGGEDTTGDPVAQSETTGESTESSKSAEPERGQKPEKDQRSDKKSGDGESAGDSGTEGSSDSSTERKQSGQGGDSGSRNRSDGARGEEESGGDLDTLSPKESDRIENSGSESAAGDREAAETVLLTYSRAFKAEDWGAACGTLSAGLLKTLRSIAASNTEVQGQGCVAAFEFAGEEGLAPDFGASLDDPIESFRVEGSRGYVIYGGNQVAMPMVKEAGSWKLDSLEPRALS